MSLADRISIYREIEAHRERPIIAYVTNTRANVGGMMSQDTILELIDQVRVVEGASVDVLVHSTGGDGLAAWKMMSVLRERFDSISVLVPYMAFSAATLFALGADEIVMHPFASLGPIDPQITITQPDGSQRQFAYEDASGFIRFLKGDADLDESEIGKLLDHLFGAVDALSIGGAKRASELANDIGSRLLETHMDDPKAAREISEGLNKSFFAHGDAVSRARAKTLNLKVSENDPTLEALLWKAYQAWESDLNLRAPFDLVAHVMQDAAAAEALRPSAPLDIPPNTPPQLQQQLWNQVLSQAVAKLADKAIEVTYDFENALMESPRLASAFVSKGSITASRTVDGKIQAQPTALEAQWRAIPIPV